MKIEILGTGCPKCQKTEELVKQALQEIGLAAEVTHVYDLQEIVRRGVISTPAVVVNGMVKLSGKLPSVEELKQLLQKK